MGVYNINKCEGCSVQKLCFTKAVKLAQPQYFRKYVMGDVGETISLKAIRSCSIRLVRIPQDSRSIPEPGTNLQSRSGGAHLLHRGTRISPKLGNLNFLEGYDRMSRA